MTSIANLHLCICSSKSNVPVSHQLCSRPPIGSFLPILLLTPVDSTDHLLQNWGWDWGVEFGGEAEDGKICSLPMCLADWCGLRLLKDCLLSLGAWIKQWVCEQGKLGRVDPLDIGTKQVGEASTGILLQS